MRPLRPPRLHPRLQRERAWTGKKARVEEEAVVRVTRAVGVGDKVAIPAGSQARGEVTVVERGGKVRDKARLGIRFTSVVLADGTRVPIETDTIYREGDSPGGESAAKIGGGAIGGGLPPRRLRRAGGAGPGVAGRGRARATAPAGRGGAAG